MDANHPIRFTVFSLSVIFCLFSFFVVSCRCCFLLGNVVGGKVTMKTIREFLVASSLSLRPSAELTLPDQGTKK